ncbi:PorP/SprF family type IX secretion system membrane protein [Pseudochryseolinea flava]|uniref:Type IX secretion system membrane protein PorP/SprF n=1 Tax=Pseudochryseolinea flava TaxID=2059302 RepID=A0A364YC86_9BACT|nr:type IX secretion system membrane protein PorP/SprF [Pseudochryseolinea flava]RAW03338.1 hypothetical protein DQQ10_04435 [Pseudochryseolinea flava]
MLKKTFYTLLLTLIGAGAFAQQDPLFTQYMFNNLYMTPAYAGVDGVTRFTAIHRSQWTGYQSTLGDGGAPTTQMVTFNTPIYKLRSGFGAYVINDRLGPQNNLEAQAMYAYHLGIKETKLSVAVKVGIFSQRINGNVYRYIDEDDPEIVNTRQQQTRPDLGFGIFYRAEKYYAGVGFNHILPNTLEFGEDPSRAPLSNHVNFVGGYFYEVSFDLRVQFSAAVRSDLNKSQIDFAGIGYLKDTMWGGLAFRGGEAASLLLGYSLLKDKSLKLGTAVDFVLFDREAKDNLSMEFMISYDLPVSINSGKRIIRTPRYRH